MIEIFVFEFSVILEGIHLLDTALHCIWAYCTEVNGLVFVKRCGFLSRPLWNIYEIACTFIPLHFMR
jgi:hypothetical protein